MLKARAEQDRLGPLRNAVLEARKLMQKGESQARGLKAKDLLQANPTSAPVQSFLKDVEVQRTQQAKDAVEKAI